MVGEAESLAIASLDVTVAPLGGVATGGEQGPPFRAPVGMGLPFMTRSQGSTRMLSPCTALQGPSDRLNGSSSWPALFTPGGKGHWGRAAES